MLQTAKSAGLRGVAFKVRPFGGGTTPGFIAIDDFNVGPKTKPDQEVAMPGVTPRPWSEFASHWDDIQHACRSSQTGSCAFKPDKIADGGNLKIVLFAAGQGVNVNFSQVGAPPAPPAAKPKKVELLDGVKHADPVKDVEEAEPATDASFQFRAEEVSKSPSAVSGTLKPICGTSACGVVVSAQKTTLFVRIAALLGAAFPDGTPAPIVTFEQP